MKIYTKTGDKGTTSLLGGTRVPKFHARLEAYGTVDELNSYIGLIREFVEAENDKQILLQVQNKLFALGGNLANEKYENANRVPEVTEADIELLEKQMDAYDKVMEPLKTFIIPGGSTAASYCHIARTVCRRAERNVVRLAEEVEINELIVRYLNRLSDFLFTLSRKVLHDVKKDEIPWQPYL